MSSPSHWLLAGVLLWILAGSRQLEAQAFTVSITDGSGVPAGTATATLQVDSAAGGFLDGFTIAVCSDPTLITPLDISPGAQLLTVNGGGPPSAFLPEIQANGFTLTIIIDFFGVERLMPADDQELAILTYGIDPAAAIGATSPLSHCQLGTPAIETLVVQSGVYITPVRLDGQIDVVSGQPPAPFVRGDVNEDGAVSVTDAVVLIQQLFLGAPAGSCIRTGDVNVDGGRDLADVVALLDGLILSAQSIPLPYPSCGFDPMPSVLDCQPYAACP